jgi:hypothetical protein
VHVGVADEPAEEMEQAQADCVVVAEPAVALQAVGRLRPAVELAVVGGVERQ